MEDQAKFSLEKFMQWATHFFRTSEEAAAFATWLSDRYREDEETRETYWSSKSYPEAYELWLSESKKNVSEDIHQGLKNVFYLFDEFCKNNGIFYDIVNDESNKQGYLIKTKDSNNLYDYIKPHTERNKVLVDVDDKRNDGILFVFSLDTIKDDGHWELYKLGKRISIFADPKSSEKVHKGTALGMAGYKPSGPKKFKKISVIESIAAITGSSIPPKLEPDTNIALATANRSSDFSPGEPKRPPKAQRKNAHDNPIDVYELQSYKRNKKDINERALGVGTKLGWVYDPNIDTPHRSNIKPIVPDPSGGQPDPLISYPEAAMVVAHEPAMPLSARDVPNVSGGPGIIGVRPQTPVGVSGPVKNTVGYRVGGQGAFGPQTTTRLPPTTTPSVMPPYERCSKCQGILKDKHCEKCNKPKINKMNRIKTNG